jgi:hypothetical protein
MAVLDPDPRRPWTISSLWAGLLRGLLRRVQFRQQRSIFFDHGRFVMTPFSQEKESPSFPVGRKET